jgi:hypothetical protein
MARLAGYDLRFHKRGRDGSAKCNAFYTGSPSARVYGVIYQMTSHQKHVLDEAEGLGRGYNEFATTVVSDRTGHPVFLYIADPGHIREVLQPFTWYKQFVLEGARFHRFPEPYVKAIEGVRAIEDPDRLRAERNLLLLKDFG